MGTWRVQTPSIPNPILAHLEYHAWFEEKYITRTGYERG